MLQITSPYTRNTDTVSSTARTMTDVGFSAAELNQAERAVITITGDAMRWTHDGTAPTAALGAYLAANSSPLVISGNANVRRLRFIRVTTDVALLVILEK